ncbi:MAG TPA: hypothetical protein VMZ73_01235 [Acidimicrobiales bacterium]|nr:hypothetical protein [Acidimicrobiales bacterium]
MVVVDLAQPHRPSEQWLAMRSAGAAKAFLRRWLAWNRYGLSAYYAEDDDAIADLAADQLDRFPQLQSL